MNCPLTTNDLEFEEKVEEQKFIAKVRSGRKRGGRAPLGDHPLVKDYRTLYLPDALLEKVFMI